MPCRQLKALTIALREDSTLLPTPTKVLGGRSTELIQTTSIQGGRLRSKDSSLVPVAFPGKNNNKMKRRKQAILSGVIPKWNKIAGNK